MWTLDFHAATQFTGTLWFFAGGTVNFTVDWGDSSPTETVSSSGIHGHAFEAGTYTVSFDGQCQAFQVFHQATSGDVVAVSPVDFTDLVSVVNFLSGEPITSLPAGMFAATPGILNALKAFEGCTELTTISGSMFDNCSSLVSLADAFSGCASLTAIPSGLFDSCTGVQDVSAAFSGCASLTAIPSGLFDGKSAITDGLASGGLSQCFAGCTALITVGDYAFRGCTGAEGFAGLFAGCTNLTTIGVDIFQGCENALSFGSVFKDCTSLSAIPANMFDDAVSVVGFGQCFSGCSSLASIPADLFQAATSCTGTARLFKDCVSLTAIPEGLFTEMRGLSRSEGVFQGCTSLTALPSILFHSDAILYLHDAWNGCTSLTEIPTEFTDSIGALGWTDRMFKDCPLVGTADGWWFRWPGQAHTAEAFEGTTVDNLTYIPAGWGGGGVAAPAGLPTVQLHDYAVAGTVGSAECEVTDEGGTPIIQRGLVWGSQPKPDIVTASAYGYDNWIRSVEGTAGAYTAIMAEVPPGQLYVRAFAVNSFGVAYSAPPPQGGWHLGLAHGARSVT